MFKSKINLGYLFGIIAYTIWGLLPPFWKLLSGIPPFIILIHRVFSLTLFLLPFVLFNKVTIVYLREKKVILVITGILLNLNWGIYIYAVNTNQILSASLGYFISPLLNGMLGIFLFKEKLSRNQKVALSIATTSTIVYGMFERIAPIISLSLAVTIVLHGYFRKKYRIDPVVGLFYESAIPCMFFMPLSVNDVLCSNYSYSILSLLFISGFVTGVPLFFYAKSLSKIPLTHLGILQYISPSLQFILAILIFKEPLNSHLLLLFIGIWSSVIIFCGDILSKR